MNDILIKGMEMPKNCIIGSIPNYEYCPMFTKCDKASGKESRPEDCPLVELPEHGDLIDRSKLSTTAITDYNLEGHLVVEIEDIENAPIILEASK